MSARQRAHPGRSARTGLALAVTALFCVACRDPSADAAASAPEPTESSEPNGTSDEPRTRTPVDEVAIPAELRSPAPGSYEVHMEPAGTWHCRQPPERLAVLNVSEADMLLMLGEIDRLVAMGQVNLRRFTALERVFYRQIPGLRVPLDGITPLSQGGGIDEEILYELNPDAVLVDPRIVVRYLGWSVDQLQRVVSRTGPFFGNFAGRRDESMGDEYAQYTMQERAEIYARMLRKEDACRSFLDYEARVIDSVESRLPPPAERPPVLLVQRGSDPAKGIFHLAEIPQDRVANGIRQYQSLGLRQSFDAERLSLGQWSSADYETLAAIDPEVIFVLQGIVRYAGPDEFHEQFVKAMQEHPLGRRIRAVRDGRVFPGGTIEEGPLAHLFQVEMAAQQLFPDRFGEWRWGEAPEQPLFDRNELAEVLGTRTR
ncbi:MAG: ABC transporter substrate-binding protein [Planctomycetota bacterium]